MSGGHVEALAGILYDHRDALTCYDHPSTYCCVCDAHEVRSHDDHLADVLAAYVAEHQAQAWDEGYEAGRGDESFDARGLMTDSDADEHPHDNPYRGAKP